MNRRNFLLGATGAVAISIPVFYFLWQKNVDPGIAEPRALSLICDTETIHAIGKQYRIQVPDENSTNKLVRLLNPGESPVNEAFLHNLSEKITRDFISGDTIIINGWILSLTEARQCALFSLIHTI
ncbi:MAG: hypothetical protein OEY34_05870 [Cyclobacteriaceae bacterium]|nr:hypothetical protein [Cyclobacteriaceae bacterium]